MALQGAADETLAQAVTPESLFRDEYRKLTRTVLLLVDDSRLAEEVVQDAFVELVARWDRISSDKARGYLYRSAMNRGRSVLRRRRVARNTVVELPEDVRGADVGVLESVRNQVLRVRIRELPRRQRRVLVLRFFAGLSVAEVAIALGVSHQAVASATRHALTTLRHYSEELR